METITIAGGCFWCTEAIFSQLKGVSSVMPGYSGGTVANPTYEAVCSGKTGHAEAVQITFDPNLISVKDILYVFFKLHDPTTLNRQGADVGTQYRSAIFYSDDSQKEAALDSIKVAQIDLKEKIVTEVSPFLNFYPAEEYHKEYYFKNKNNNPYCTIVIDPKVQKLKKEFANLVK